MDLVSSFPYYNKAPFILRMFRYLITDEIFREGVRKYVSRQAFHSTATSNNFWTAMEDALDEKLEPEYIYEHNINLRDTMIGWMKQEHYPVVSLIRDYHFGWVSVWLESYVQSEMQELGIPLTFTSQTYPNFNRTSLRDVKWLKYKGITDWPRLSGFSMNREENGWIIANLQQSGYYRVNYDSENWNRITTYLNSEEYTKIHVLNRAQIIDDSFHLAIQEQQSFSLFWNLTRYLSRETDYIAWYPMFKALEYMSNIFPFQNRIVDDIKISLYKILGDLLARIGYHRQFNENIFTEYLRQEATKWACTLNYQDCLKEANNKLQQYFIHPERNILFPWWKEWTYCEGLKLTDRYTWWSLVHTLLEKDSYIQKTNKTLEMLACPQDLNIIKEYLKLITFNIKNPNLLKIEQFENIHIFHSIVAKHSNDFGILEHIFSNFFGIKPSKVSTIAALIDIINHVYSEEQLKKVSQLIDRISLIEEESNIEGSLSSYIEYKVNLRSSQIEKQATFLQLLKPAEDVMYIRR
ncbi:aminopeptidase N-like [Formica exsecta]|uniref:aminopeptidase N-like n=1 Tax=Formica exsecta TaxID=72781 RepID=UPI001144E812|nr:aminopeptidase N-like [Formica exsecta]